MSLALLMAAGFSFDANQVAPDAGQMGPLPAGWYSVIVADSSIEATKDGAGAYIKAVFKVLEPNPQFVNRPIYVNFNIKNNNQQAVDIAMGQLSALSHAIGVLNWQDTQQLHNIPLKVRVKVRPGSDGYDPSNNITAFKPITEDVVLGPEQGNVKNAGAVPQHPGNQQPSMGAPQVQQPQVQQPQQQWQQNPAQQQPNFQQQQPQVQQPVQQQPMQQVQQPIQQQPVQQQQPQTAQQPWEQNGAAQAQQQQPQVYQQQPQQQVQQPQQQPVQQQQVYQQPNPAQQQPVQQQAQPQGGEVPPWVNQQ